MAALLCFASLSLNLLLDFALGIREMVSRERSPRIHCYYPWAVLFVSTALLWVFFARLISFLGIFDYLLVFPLSALAGLSIEKLFFRLFPRLGENPRIFKIGSPYNGLSAAALVLTLQFAAGFGEALSLSAGFALGGLFAFFIIKEIQKRSFLEAIPYSLRGTPLLLISMGILALVFSAVSVLLLKMLLT
jgi:electron transport complex protein RnfA